MSKKAMPREKKPTERSVNIFDIAEQAKVSIATVSRYFRNPEIVAKKTRDKIEKIVEREGYFPSLSGPNKEIINNKIAFLYDIETEPKVFGQILTGVLRGAQIYDYDVLTYIWQDERKDHSHDRAIINRVEAIIFTKVKSEEYLEKIRKNNIRIVYLIDSLDEYHSIKNEKDIFVVVDSTKLDNVIGCGVIAISLVHKLREKNHGASYKIVDNVPVRMED